MTSLCQRIVRQDPPQIAQQLFLGTVSAPPKQQAQLRSRKSQNLVHHPVKSETLVSPLQSGVTTITERDVTPSGQHDERVNAEHGRAAVSVLFVVVHGSRHPVLGAGKCWRFVTQSALALAENNLQQIMLGSACVRAMIV